MVKLDRNAVLEYATFKVPYEELNMEFRRGHKNMERVGVALKRSISTLRNVLSEKDGCVSVGVAREAFRDFKSKLEQLDAAKKDAVRKQRQFIRNMQARIQFLRNEDISSEKGIQDLQLWRRDRQQVARLICLQMLRCGHIESATALAKEMDVQDIVDLEVFNKVEKVVDALLNKDTGPCLEWIAEHRSKLRRMNSKLEQIVRVQNAVELVRANKVKEALLYVRKHLGTTKDDWCDEAMKLMGLIALCANNSVPAYKELLSEQRWQSLADLFRQEVFTLYQLPRQSAFAVCLQCGLSAYKTPHCSPGGVERCPTCQPCAYALAEGLPYAHTVNSRLICSYSGEALNEENHPMMMPDGRVYGEKAIRELQIDNMVRCPRTGNMIPIDHVLKLYVL
ncbi:hypothetical protein Q1695_008606 [Nippostrongylus brasiliensis]|nr:hypothetical protein Q1695_008606 [Nippostrongylus brasiliensis]